MKSCLKQNQHDTVACFDAKLSVLILGNENTADRQTTAVCMGFLLPSVMTMCSERRLSLLFT